MKRVTEAIMDLFRYRGDRDVPYFSNLAYQVISGKSTSPVSDMVRLVGFPYQLVYKSQDIRYDN